MRDDIVGFNARIKDKTAIKFSAEIGTLKTQLDNVKKQLANAKKSGDFDLQIKLNAEVERLSQQLTQAKRQLRNYARTGSEDISVLGKKFQEVNNNIKNQGSVLSQALGQLKGLASAYIGFEVIKQVSAYVVDLGSKLEQATVSFTTML